MFESDMVMKMTRFMDISLEKLENMVERIKI